MGNSVKCDYYGVNLMIFSNLSENSSRSEREEVNNHTLIFSKWKSIVWEIEDDLILFGK